MTDDAPRRLEYMDLSDLLTRRDPDNAKEHAQEDLAASVDRFGYVEPVVLDERTGLLASGHGRVEELARRREQNEQDVPDGVMSKLEGSYALNVWYVPVVRGWSSADDGEATAWRIAANELTTAGGWDQARLVQQLDDLLSSTRQLAGTGFDLDRLEDLAASLGAGQLGAQDTDAEHAPLPEQERQVAGIHDVHLPFQDEAHRRYLAALAHLRHRWGAQLSAPEVILRALEAAVSAEPAA